MPSVESTPRDRYPLSFVRADDYYMRRGGAWIKGAVAAARSAAFLLPRPRARL